jgi:putative flippase GtrA
LLGGERAGLLSIHRLLKFGTIGVVNTGVYYGLYVLLHMALPYLVAHTVAFALAMVGSYFLNCWVTFRIRPSWRTFLLFPLSNLTNFTITTIGLQVAVAVLHWSPLWAPLPVAIVAVPFTYIVAHYVMLGRSHKRHAEAAAADDIPSPNY